MQWLITAREGADEDRGFSRPEVTGRLKCLAIRGVACSAGERITYPGAAS